MNIYNDFLQQVYQLLDLKIDATFLTSARKRPVESFVKTETPKTSQIQRTIKDETAPSPFRLSNYSVKPKLESKSNNHFIKAEPKAEAKSEVKTEPKPETKTAAPRTANLDSTLPTYKKDSAYETSNEPSSTTKRKLIAKRVFVDLTDAISSDDDDEDETPSKKARMG